MNIEQVVLYNLLSLGFSLITHELGHFLIARILKYSANFSFNFFKFEFITVVENLNNPFHKKLIACAGCISTLCCVILLKIININEDFTSICTVYTIIFFLNLHPRLPDGKIFWQ